MDGLCILLFQLLALDDDLDVFLVSSARLVVAPPNWSLILALEAEMLAGRAVGRDFVTLLSSQAASVASCLFKSVNRVSFFGL